MQKLFIATGTVTWALRGRDVLRRNGFTADIEKNTSLSESGCGYGITVTGNRTAIIDALKNASVKVLNIYEL